MNIYYLEIVSENIAETCQAYQASLGIEFSEIVEALGNAKVAKLKDGGMIGVRAPMHESEHPVVRPYWLVKDIHSALAKAETAGATVAHPVLEIPEYGFFAIYIQGGNQHGLWQLLDK